MGAWAGVGWCWCGAVGAERGLRPAGRSQAEASLESRLGPVQRWSSSGSQSRDGGLGLRPVPPATVVVPEPREGYSLRVGLGSRQPGPQSILGGLCPLRQG